MIDRQELESKSAELGVHVSHVQRDYVFGWLLSGMFQSNAPLSQALSLKGGNAFRKAYFENARYSNDLDFSTVTAISEDDLRAALVEASHYGREHSGVDFLVGDEKVRARPSADGEGNMYEGRVYFRSFYGDGKIRIRVNLDVKEFDRIILPVQTRRLIHSYSDADNCVAELRCHKLEELLASKLVALLHRRHSPDLFDFVRSVFFQKSLEISRRELIMTFLKKTIYETNPNAARGLLLDLPFAVFKGFWAEYLVCPREIVLAFDDAETRFKQVISELFSLVTPQPAYAGTTTGTYYRGSVRDAILEAGRLQRLLRVVYDGHERLVEPYALTYKRRKDGIGNEYFYGWDLSGGRSGTTGIKSFVADKVVSAAVTEQTFDPKFPIELTKTGTGYFTRSSFASESVSSGRRRRSRARTTGRYTVQCPYCGKRFKRTRLTTRLNRHKDRFGNRCYGRIGFVVG